MLKSQYNNIFLVSENKYCVSGSVHRPTLFSLNLLHFLNNIFITFSMLRQAGTRFTFVVKTLHIVGSEILNKGYITQLDGANESWDVSLQSLYL